MRTVTWDEVYARRLAASRLDRRASHGELLDVAAAVCGVHAQLLTGAELALSARVEGVTRDEVAELLWERRSLVKANTIRGTLHLHPAADFRLWKSVRAAYPQRWREQSWLDWQELTLAQAEHLRAAVLDALADGEPRTRAEVGASVGGTLGAHIAADSWGHYLAPAGDLLCQGPPRGRNVTFVRCDRWVEESWDPLAPEDALREALSRYLRVYGPARPDDFEHWLARPLPESVFDGLEEIDVEGVRMLVLPATEFPAAGPSGVRLLGHYDVYVIACHPRDHLIPAQRERIFLRGAGPHPALLVDGRVAGVWTRTRRGRRIEVEVEPFIRLSKGQRAELADDAQRVARTYGCDAVVV